MHNQTLIQYFHWNYNEADNLWTKAVKEAANLYEIGITKVWFPPAYKGSNGALSVGYEAYDLFDLGEFDQKNSVVTKYGSKDEYIDAINALHQNKIGVIADAVFNHKAGGDELEKIHVRKVNSANRAEFISEEFEIEAWTKFNFPDRQGKYSEFIWDHQCFSGIDWAEDTQESAIFSIQNKYGDAWENVPSSELGNYDYLMFNDIDFRNEAVRNELKNWGTWYCELTKVDGFRLDAVKHISHEFLVEWIDHMKTINPGLFVVSENWNVEDVRELEEYIELTGGRTQLFDSLLHHNLYLAAKAGNDFDLSTIFHGTLVEKNPTLAVTFVDNHDSQPMQALESYTEQWFRASAYAMILLREQGIPCVFYIDLYGAAYEEQGTVVDLPVLEELVPLLQLRRDKAYGLQRDYLDHPNCIGWTREGNDDNGLTGLAVVLSNGEKGVKKMEVGEKFAGKIFVDALQKRAEDIMIDGEGWGEFFCAAGSVSVWVLK